MEALAALVSGVAHDFNNLLTVVMGNLDLLRRAAEERKPRLIENAIRAVEQGRKLTGQLLAFGRRQALQPEVVELPRLMAATQDMLTQSLRGGIELRLDLAEDLWPVRADPSQLQIALINLAANARDAMPKGGTFTLAAENLALGGDRSTEAVALSVSDTGVGIPRDTLARVFEPFFTTKEVGQGSGLGLAQVYGFAQQSGGSVDVRSEPGRGTAVALYLPPGPSGMPQGKRTCLARRRSAHARRGRSGSCSSRTLRTCLRSDGRSWPSEVTRSRLPPTSRRRSRRWKAPPSIWSAPIW
jgi:signal transduction histidine kinase